MTPELWQRLNSLFSAALEEDPHNRAEFVDMACGANAELKRQLLLLLHQADQEGSALDKPLFDVKTLFQAAAPRFHPGETVLGRFRILRVLGRGGMGEVFEAQDLQLGRIALKTIRTDTAFSTGAYEQFRQEVQLARRVSGPQVCRIHELFLIPATESHPATPFLTMEYLEGETLSEKLHHDGPLSPKATLPIIADICEGLRLLHQQGLVHRDLKCANVMLCDRSGSPHAVLMDFGLAWDSIERPSQSTDTTPSTASAALPPQQIAGTPAYMAPEQFEGQRVSPATDIYALGVVLYELLTGIHPFAASTPVGAAIRRARQPAPASSLQRNTPRHWNYVIGRCLEYEPARRFQTPEQVIQALRRGPANLGNLTRDRPWVLRLAGSLVLAAIAWGLFLWWQTSHYYRPNAGGTRWYNAGLASLRQGNYLTAAQELEKSTQQDTGFAMSHARLAEAWSNLDFDGKAEKEMLIASSGDRQVPPLDRAYLDAIRATLTHDFAGSLALYQQILRRLPTTEKPAGYVDLGMALERAGDPKNALASFAQAARLDPDNAAAQMQTAILESKLHDLAPAEQAFQRAEALLDPTSDPEGFAELDYQRGYLANQREATAEADAYLNKARDEATQLHDVQLEIRCLTQLSSVAYSSDRDEEAVQLAEQAIRLARDNQLDAWAADGLVREANARLNQGRFPQAEDALQQALQIARQSQQHREEALANLVLAGLRDQQNRPDDVVAPAQAALNYYRANGYFEPQADASLLLIRAQEGKGQFQQALQSANSFLAMANRSGSGDLIVKAEESVASPLFDMELYPDALVHFQRSLDRSQKNIDKVYEALHCANTLEKLGRYAEADSDLKIGEALLRQPGATANGAMLVAYAEVEVESLLGQQKYEQASTLAGDVLAKYPTLQPDDRQQLQLNKAIAEAHLGHKAAAWKYLTAGLAKDPETDDKVHNAEAGLQESEIALATGRTREAFDAAVETESYYASTAQRESQLRSAWLAAAAAQQLDDPGSAAKYSQKSVDILAGLQQTWGRPAVHTYLERPDIHALAGKLVPKGQKIQENS